MTIAQTVIERDHRWEVEAEAASAALAELRWHWTLNEDNPDRVSFSDYAKAVGRKESNIRVMANAFAEKIRTGRDVQTTVQLQAVREADRAITEAVAKATNVSPSTTRQHYKEDVRRVRNAVAELREEDPEMSPERQQEAINRSAQMIANERKAEKARHEQRKKSIPLTYLVIEGKIQKARDAVTDALDSARADLPSSDIDVELMEALLAAADRLLAAVKLLQTALGAEAQIDWDAELAKLAAK